MTDKGGIEFELELRRRLLPHVVAGLNRGVIHTATEALRELLTDVPEYADEFLQPIWERSDYWPEQMAKEALGLPDDEEFEIEELLELFDQRKQEERCPSETGEE